MKEHSRDVHRRRGGGEGEGERFLRRTAMWFLVRSCGAGVVRVSVPVLSRPRSAYILADNDAKGLRSFCRFLAANITLSQRCLTFCLLIVSLTAEVIWMISVLQGGCADEGEYVPCRASFSSPSKRRLLPCDQTCHSYNGSYCSPPQPSSSPSPPLPALRHEISTPTLSRQVDDDNPYPIYRAEGSYSRT